MQLEQRSVPFEKIETNQYGFVNPRTYLGDITELKKTIEEKGLLVNPVIWETQVKGKVHYIVLIGHRRVESIRQIRAEVEATGGTPPYEDLTCSVFDGDLEGAMSIALIDHLQHKSLNPADLAQAVTKLVEKVGNQSKVGEILGMSQENVSVYYKLFRNLIPAVLEALRINKIKVSQARKLATLINSDKTPNAAAQEAELERMTAKPSDEADNKPAEPVRQRAKTHRSKHEVETLRVRLAQMDKDNGEVDAEYRQNLGKFLKWYFCSIDDEEVCFSSPETAASAPKVEKTEEPADAPKKKRRIADVVA